ALGAAATLRQRARREAIIAVRAARVGEPPHRVAGRVAAFQHHVGRQLMRAVAVMDGDRSVLVDLVVAEERMAVAFVAAPLTLLVVLVLEPCLHLRRRLAAFRLPSRERRSAEHGGERDCNEYFRTLSHRINPIVRILNFERRRRSNSFRSCNHGSVLRRTPAVTANYSMTAQGLAPGRRPGKTSIWELQLTIRPAPNNSRRGALDTVSASQHGGALNEPAQVRPRWRLPPLRPDHCRRALRLHRRGARRRY